MGGRQVQVRSRDSPLACRRFPADGTYYEPFLGAGAVFLAYAPRRAILSDLNPDLIRAFTSVRNSPAQVAKKLCAMHRRDSESAYYNVRALFNCGGPDCLQAARFIYLNQTSFNGIYRVNREGQYNVPYGFKSQPTIPGKQHLESVFSFAKVCKRSS